MRWCFLLLAILIAGCTTTTRQDFEGQPDEVIDSWQMKGRLAARIDNDGGSASFIWQRSQSDHSIELYGPLGSGRVFLKQTQGQASLIDNQAVYSGENLQQVLYQRVGWLIPFDDMQQWVVGQPQQDLISNQIFKDGRLSEFSQSGWRVSYDNYDEFSGRLLPSKITITTEPYFKDELSLQLGRPVDNLRVKLIIKQFVSG